MHLCNCVYIGFRELSDAQHKRVPRGLTLLSLAARARQYSRRMGA